MDALAQVMQLEKGSTAKIMGQIRIKVFFFLSQITEEFCIGFIYIHIEK